MQLKTYDYDNLLDTIRTYTSFDTINPYSVVVTRFDKKPTYTLIKNQTQEHHTFNLYNAKNGDSLKIDSTIVNGNKTVTVSTPKHLLERRIYDIDNNLTQRCTYIYNSSGRILSITIDNKISIVRYEFEYDDKGIRTNVYRNKQIIDNQELQNLMYQHPSASTYELHMVPFVTPVDSRVFSYETIFDSQGLPVRVKISETNGSFLKSWTEIYVYEYY